jgi:hypothetical protein
LRILGKKSNVRFFQKQPVFFREQPPHEKMHIYAVSDKPLASTKKQSNLKINTESLGGSEFCLYLCNRLLFDALYIYYMQINTLNQSQMMILESFAGAQDEQEVNDLVDVLRDFYAKRLEREMQRLWEDGTFDDKTLEQIRGEHLRTPYHYPAELT